MSGSFFLFSRIVETQSDLIGQQVSIFASDQEEAENLLREHLREVRQDESTGPWREIASLGDFIQAVVPLDHSQVLTSQASSLRVDVPG